MKKKIKPNLAFTVKPIENGTSGSGMSLLGFIRELRKCDDFNLIILTTQSEEVIPGITNVQLKKRLGFYFLPEVLDIDYLHIVPFTWRYFFLLLKKTYIKHTTIHGFASLELKNRFISKLHDLIVRRVLVLFIDEIYTVSYHSKDYINKLYKLNAHVIYNGVDAFFPMNPAEEIASLKSKSNTILHVSNFSDRKNPQFISELIEEFQESNKNARFIIVGNGWKDSTLAKKYKLNPNVNILGFVSEEQLKALFIQAKIFIFPSLYEGFGMPNLEAMASGTRVVTSNKGSIPEIVNNYGTCLEFNLWQWCETIEGMLNTPYTTEEIINRQAYVKDYTWKRMCMLYTNTCKV